MYGHMSTKYQIQQDWSFLWRLDPIFACPSLDFECAITTWDSSSQWGRYFDEAKSYLGLLEWYGMIRWYKPNVQSLELVQLTEKNLRFLLPALPGSTKERGGRYFHQRRYTRGDWFCPLKAVVWGCLGARGKPLRSFEYICHRNCLMELVA